MKIHIDTDNKSTEYDIVIDSMGRGSIIRNSDGVQAYYENICDLDLLMRIFGEERWWIKNKLAVLRSIKSHIETTINHTD